MGLLTTGGAPYMWGDPANDKAILYIREHGIKQFINIFRKNQDLKNCPFLWGDEIEGCVVEFPKEKKSLKLSLTAHHLIEKLETDDETKATVKWLPEYGSFMIECTPAAPYTDSLRSLLSVEENMNARYAALRRHAGPNGAVLTLVSFPLMGQGDFVASEKPLAVRGEFSDSLFVPDECINGTHPRFGTLTRNIRLRRGRKVCIQVPMFIDVNTLDCTVDKVYKIDSHPMNKAIDCGAPTPGAKSKSVAFESSDEEEEPPKPVKRKSTSKARAASIAAQVVKKKTFEKEFAHLFTPSTNYYYGQYTEPDDDAKMDRVQERYNACPCPVPSVSHPCVYMDCMAFGMGNSCLQVTMQMPDVDKCRHMFDQLAVLCPMFLAVTAATPFQKGILCDSDVRWLTIAASVDDRKRSEVPRIIKSRYDHVSLYLSPRTKHLEAYNDDHVEVDEATLENLVKEGFDERMARHVAHLFIRDPLVIFDRRIETLDDEKETDHFENIQSTNWQTVRFKPPPVNTNIGWRVEFRIMEIQPTAFENAAFSVFLSLLTQAILKYDLFTLIPMSLVDQNMGRAHCRDPVKTQKFWVRKEMADNNEAPKPEDFEEKTVDEIFNGPNGLVSIVKKFVAEHVGDTDGQLTRYIELVSKRASGELKTTASFLRDFVTAHPAYQRDSRLNEEIAHDLARMVECLALGEIAFDDYLPASLLETPRPKKRSRD